MTITEQERHDLYERLQERLGMPEAQTLMQYLPLAGFAELATKSDLNALGSSLRAEINAVDASLRAEMRHGFEVTDMKFAAMDLKMEAMEHRILGTMRQEMRLQLLAMVGIAIALAGLILRFG